MQTSGTSTISDIPARQRWLSILAKADAASIEAKLASFDALPSWQFVRAPETGMAMVRARAGGDGRAFNLGDMTVTRCSVRLETSAHLGHAYVAGTDKRHAELTAVCDALLQMSAWHAPLQQQVITPLAQAQGKQRLHASREAAATKVDFYTLVRD